MFFYWAVIVLLILFAIAVIHAKSKSVYDNLQFIGWLRKETVPNNIGYYLYFHTEKGSFIAVNKMNDFEMVELRTKDIKNNMYLNVNGVPHFVVIDK